MKLNINDVAALAIKNNTKRVEVRVGKESNEYDFSKLNKNDIIEFNSNNLGIFYVKVK
jgi:ASC-1-like (ASCH) protein